MPEAFVPLREWLAPAVQPQPEPEPVVVEEPSLAEIRPECDAYGDLAREVRFFQAALREALDERVRVLVREIAIDVVARELRLAPVDIAAVVESACSRYASPLSVRVHPDEVHAVRGVECVIGDAGMRRGDALLVVSGGTIDASLGMRLARVLAAAGA